MSERTEHKPESADTLTDSVLGVSRMIDSTYPPDLDREAWLWRRCMKVVEESGEATTAILGLLGENPRKGQTHTGVELRKELLDVALAALGAVAHLTGNTADPIRLLDEHARRVHDRLAAVVCPPVQTEGGAS